jgi:hypothetical protein
MASQYPPKKNTQFILYFSLYKSDGTIIANPGTYTKKVSIDGAGVADIAASVTEEDTTYGQLSLVIAAGEMNGDAIWIYIKDDTTGCIPFTCTLYTTGSLHDEVRADVAAIHVHIDDLHDTDIPAIKSDTAAVLVDTTAIKADTNELQTDWANGGRLDLLLDGASAPTAAAVADAVWDELLADHVIVGSTSAGVAAAGGSGDPWSTALPGAYGAGTAGKIIGDNINASSAVISSNVSSIKDKTDNLPASPAATGAQMDLVDAPNATAVTAIQTGLATPTNITAGTITNLTNAPTAGDFTATMKASITAAVPTAAAIKAAMEAGGGDLALIMAQTDKLTFTVTNQIDANIQYVNDTQITGDGSSGTPWSPV